MPPAMHDLCSSCRDPIIHPPFVIEELGLCSGGMLLYSLQILSRDWLTITPLMIQCFNLHAPHHSLLNRTPRSLPPLKAEESCSLVRIASVPPLCLPPSKVFWGSLLFTLSTLPMLWSLC